MPLPAADPLDRADAELRGTFGSFATGLAVICAERDGTSYGMTASAFTPVSLDPPLVLVSIACTAKISSVIEEGGSYSVSILSAEQSDIARHFAARGGAANIRFERLWGRPLLAGAIAQLDCDVVQAIPAGDHILFIGRVRAHTRVPGAPLIYHRGAFGPPEAFSDIAPSADASRTARNSVAP